MRARFLGSRPYYKGSTRDYHTLRAASNISPVTRELSFPSFPTRDSVYKDSYFGLF